MVKKTYKSCDTVSREAVAATGLIAGEFRPQLERRFLSGKAREAGPTKAWLFTLRKAGTEAQRGQAIN